MFVQSCQSAWATHAVWFSEGMGQLWHRHALYPADRAGLVHRWRGMDDLWVVNLRFLSEQHGIYADLTSCSAELERSLLLSYLPP